MKKHYTDIQRITPGGHPSGVDHGSDGQVLVSYGDHLLVWRPGHHAYWGGGQQYIRAELQVLAPVTGWGVYPKTVFKGRWSRRRLIEYMPQIHKLLGLPVGTIDVFEIDRWRTLVLKSC